MLPMTRREMKARGITELDILLVTGDAYVDHPAFGTAVVGRWLESLGYRVGVVAQPDWRGIDDLLRMGPPRLFVGVSAGNLDSLLANRTASGKPRRTDEYSPGGRAGLRPDRACIVYANLCRQAFGRTPVVLGGIEASLRRIAHYDTWSDRVRRSILLDAKADLLVYGMAESALETIATHLRDGGSIGDLPAVRGTAIPLGRRRFQQLEEDEPGAGLVRLPSFAQVRDDRRAFSEMTRRFHREQSPFNGRPLLQPHGDEAVLLRPPALPLGERGLDQIYELPFTRRAHPRYRESVPALETVAHSVVATRGCPGGCAFCALTEHQGRSVQSRTPASIRREVRAMAGDRRFRGTITDVGGPTANVYGLGCTRPDLEARCRRSSCLYPRICRHFATDQEALVELLASLRRVAGVRHVYLASGIRHDLALRSPRFIRAMAQHHTPGQLSVAPEHVCPEVLRRMKKPGVDLYEQFASAFERASDRAGKEQYLIPYLIAGHPGSTLDHMIDLALYLKQRSIRPRQVQQFVATPMTLATSMAYTGLDPFSGEAVHSARSGVERRLQKALLLYWDPAHHADVRRALRQAGRADLIGPGPDCLVPPARGQGALARHARRKPKPKGRSKRR
ncbi:MAG: YgiQ family radical SAM protein [Deltaproteobacteria bacterium]|jgi:uncharacterized radical SAM protein YgiQ|nr:YgiQ family radical SAM protein [Deltaproteobacteria bacterium]MBW2536850.1 YgiQ family radical SAM protein [Deltaproteobacteria bacterium]